VSYYTLALNVSSFFSLRSATATRNLSAHKISGKRTRLPEHPQIGKSQQAARHCHGQ